MYYITSVFIQLNLTTSKHHYIIKRCNRIKGIKAPSFGLHKFHPSPT